MSKLVVRFFSLDLLIEDGKLKHCVVKTELPTAPGTVVRGATPLPPEMPLPPETPPRRRRRKAAR